MYLKNWSLCVFIKLSKLVIFKWWCIDYFYFFFLASTAFISLIYLNRGRSTASRIHNIALGVNPHLGPTALLHSHKEVVNFLHTLSMWAAQLSLESRMIPKYFTSVYLVSSSEDDGFRLRCVDTESRRHTPIFDNFNCSLHNPLKSIQKWSSSNYEEIVCVSYYIEASVNQASEQVVHNDQL